MQPRETIIRDQLATRLGILEPGLTLLDIEHYIPSGSGARGFLDILARDRNGLFVLVELKRSDSSAREALHELLKYLGLFVAKHGLRRAQIRCFIVSTTWHELRVPFAELSRTESFQFEGYQLNIAPDGTPLAAHQIQPVSPEELALDPAYWIACFTDPDHRAQTVRAMASSLKRFPDLNCLFVEHQYEGNNPNICYPFSATLAVPRLSAEQVRSYLANMQPTGPICCEDVAAHGEVIDAEQDDEDEHDEISSLGWHLIDAAAASAPRFPRDIGCIGPFQFVARENDGWRATRWERIGSAWADTSLWSEEDLHSLLAAYDADNGIYLKFVTSPKNRLDWSNRLKQVAEFLKPDTHLRDLVGTVLSEFSTTDKRGTLTFVAFYPEDLLLAVCSSILAPDDPFTPSIEFVMVPEGERAFRHIRCVLCWNGTTVPSTTTATLKAVYGTPLAYQLASTMHEHFAYRSKLLAELGLVWRVFEHVVDPPSVRELSAVGTRVRRTEVQPNSIPTLRSLVEASWNWACELALFVSHGNPRQFDRTALPVPPNYVPTDFFKDAPDRCDLCNRGLSGLMYDAAVSPMNMWACMCRFCFVFSGARVGWGHGQEYAQTRDGRWTLITGGPENDD
ncbi:MAG: endonuclease NucS domain-containing protein [Thermodesulfobacteriota bacterium]